MEENRIHTAIQDTLVEASEVLYEKWSHSEELDDAMEKVYDAIAETSGHNEVKTIIPQKLSMRRGKTDVELFGMPIHLEYFMYVATDDETAEYVLQNGYEKNGLSEDEKTLYITIYTVNGEVLEGPSNKNIGHELEHLLQISKSKVHNPHYTKLMDMAYEQASRILSGDKKSTKIERNIAWLYYFSNPREQDAFANEYYYELCSMSSFLGDNGAEAIVRLEKYKFLLDWYFENKEDKEVQAAVNAYTINGMPRKNFEKMIRSGLLRYQRKLGNIQKHFREKSSELKENMYRHGIYTHHGSLYVVC